ncbi:MAG: RDD family protein [Acidimicrobiales bacterium]|nr:RDD family protein [Acidimicrobiales bacterium]
MTAPTPDPSGNIAPGHYHAEGDPPGYVRYWDGTQWVGDAMPPAPTAGPAGAVSDSGGADVGMRILAVLIDGVIGVAISIIVAIPFFEDTSDRTGDDFSFEINGPGIYLGWLVFLAISIALITTKGGSPGKLATGMRIRSAAGTNPSVGVATLRSVPWLVTLIPVLGVIVWIVIALAGTIMIATDPLNRSLFDRIASTRVYRS